MFELIKSLTVYMGGGKMATVKVSSKYQVVIPEVVRNALDNKPGMQVSSYSSSSSVFENSFRYILFDS